VLDEGRGLATGFVPGGVVVDRYCTFASFQKERHAGPSFVFDTSDGCAEGGATRVLGHVFFVCECWFLAIGGLAVLAYDRLDVLDGCYRFEDTDLSETLALCSA